MIQSRKIPCSQLAKNHTWCSFLHIQIQHHVEGSCLTLPQATSIFHFLTKHIQNKSKAQPAQLQSMPRDCSHLGCFDENKHLLCLESHLNVMCFTRHKRGCLIFRSAYLRRPNLTNHREIICTNNSCQNFSCLPCLQIYTVQGGCLVSHVGKFFAFVHAGEKLHPDVLNI